MEIIQYIGCFINRVQETKMLMQLMNKKILIEEPVL